MARQYKKRIKSGKKRGSSLGYPTLNLAIPLRFPYVHGVYAGWVKIEGEKYNAAIHYGPIPVFGEESTVLEAHVIGKKIENTPKKVTFGITHFIRDIKTFQKVEHLIEQIEKDLARITEILD